MPFIVVGVLFLLLAGAVAVREQRRYAVWPKAQAQCVGATSELRRETDGTRRTLVRAVYRFQAEGRSVDAPDPQAGDKPRHLPGAQVTLAFDPADPLRISLGMPRFLVGVVAGLGLLSVAVGTVGELYARAHPQSAQEQVDDDDANDPAEQP